MTRDANAPRSWTSGIAVVIPSYKVTRHILGVLAAIGPEVDAVYCVDDACPDNSGEFIERNATDPRVRVLRNPHNQGVGGAMITGYQQAIADGATVIVKIDGDGQMDPALLPAFVAPILAGEADYTKGNRFWDLAQIRQMPLARRIGNLGLSFMAKASTGYWDVFDPTNGYTAIHARVAAMLPFNSISRRYFFETDILFRLNTVRAVVIDVPMDARYGDETSGLKASKIFFEFLFKHARNLGKRVGYNYFLRDLSLASLELLAAVLLLGFGLGFGGWHWVRSVQAESATPVGTVMIATVAVVSGLQFLLAFFGYDIASVPRRPLSQLLARRPLIKRISHDE
ncbi:Glycosyltransferase involved in cell wall bisynthesis [Lysobacter sp. yr284]|uniref:glycosyltransferase family 2 protein n=1 Tax=Lysobacter TaxID=68 RepID=UPI000898C020|nr:glycosyltransferase family 2 protein [Lysobacter sp. yr284]SDY61596.1 Glycosyltransferase involved in cell wall bisynthesis [Lysobacter sp. yr284]